MLKPELGSAVDGVKPKRRLDVGFMFKDETGTETWSLNDDGVLTVHFEKTPIATSSQTSNADAEAGNFPLVDDVDIEVNRNGSPAERLLHECAEEHENDVLLEQQMTMSNAISDLMECNFQTGLSSVAPIDTDDTQLDVPDTFDSKHFFNNEEDDHLFTNLGDNDNRRWVCEDENASFTFTSTFDCEQFDQITDDMLLEVDL